jgi:hypothetical protein
MDLSTSLNELRAEREKLDRLISAVEQYGAGSGGAIPKRRGRPPGSGGTGKKTTSEAMVKAKVKVPKKSGRRKFTPAQKAEQAKRMKKYWSARKAGKLKLPKASGKKSGKKSVSVKRAKVLPIEESVAS